MAPWTCRLEFDPAPDLTDRELRMIAGIGIAMQQAALARFGLDVPPEGGKDSAELAAETMAMLFPELNFHAMRDIVDD
jgi:hypothetical protein